MQKNGLYLKQYLKYLILTSSIFLLYVSLAVATAAKLLASAVAFGQGINYTVSRGSRALELPGQLTVQRTVCEKCTTNQKSSDNLKLEIFPLHF